MKGEASAREGFVALTSPEAEWEEKRSQRTCLLGPLGYICFAMWIRMWWQNLGKRGNEKAEEVGVAC